MLTKILSTLVVALLLALFTLGLLYNHTRNSLNELNTQYESLTKDFKELSESKELLSKTKESTERLINEQQEGLLVVEKEKETLKDRLRKYAAISCTNMKVSNNEIKYVDVNAKYDNDYLQLFNDLGKN
jgi:predicted nuclease with TOPRIM domain